MVFAVLQGKRLHVSEPNVNFDKRKFWVASQEKLREEVISLNLLFSRHSGMHLASVAA